MIYDITLVVARLGLLCSFNEACTCPLQGTHAHKWPWGKHILISLMSLEISNIRFDKMFNDIQIRDFRPKYDYWTDFFHESLSSIYNHWC